MPKQIPATDAKNNFGGLLDDVQALGRVEITKHGRVVAVLLSPRELAATQMPSLSASEQVAADKIWGRTHMIPPELARQAIVTKPSIGFDDD